MSINEKKNGAQSGSAVAGVTRREFAGEQKKRCDFPPPSVGAVGVHVWHDDTEHGFRVCDHYAESHDVRDPTKHRISRWREHMVTKCVYTCECHDGSNFYLFEDRWNDCTITSNSAV